jgi:methylmalonyl-CoA/ethylmalonyl-CoA epimerase
VIISIEHVALASADLHAAVTFLRELGMQPWHQEDLLAEGVRSNQFASGDAVVEILEALRDDAPVHRFVSQRGPGLHHVCFRVDNLDATILHFQQLGLELVSPQPREDQQGRRVFLHPRSGQGVLMGFVERHPPERPVESGRPTRRRTVDPGWRSFERLTFVPAVAVRGEVVFTSGLNAIDDDGNLLSPGDVVGQTRAIYEKLATLLAAAGGSLHDLVKTTDFVLSREGYAATAAVRAEFLGPEFPAATGVVVKELLGRGVLIEIEAVAVLGGTSAGAKPLPDGPE